jgi:hypothetical protein
MESIKIVAGSILAAILYGVVHDQVTARICVEYFTVFHPPVFATQSPTLLGLGWGIIATWWMGALLGVLLALAARAGSRPKITLEHLIPSIAKVLAFMALCALVFGVLGYVFGTVPSGMAGLLPSDSYHRFAADWWAHNASYASGLLGGLALCIFVYTRRVKLQKDAAGIGGEGSGRW